GSCISRLRKGRLGVVCPDRLGAFIAARAIPVHFGSDPLEYEAVAVRSALILARYMGEEDWT
ncbi:hypothetical protein Dimus_020190, partial [Dionaea muscipula]